MAKYDLARFRREHTLTQKQLAEVLSVSQGFLSSIENGRTPFPEERRKDFEKAFPGVNLDDYRSIEGMAEEIKEMNPVQKRGFMAQLHRAISNLLLEGDDIDEDDEENFSLIEDRNGDKHQSQIEVDREVLDQDGVPLNWKQEVQKVLTQNNEMAVTISQLKLDKEALIQKNDELRDKLHEARKEVFDLQNEIIRLKALLIEHQITDMK